MTSTAPRQATAAMAPSGSANTPQLKVGAPLDSRPTDKSPAQNAPYRSAERVFEDSDMHVDSESSESDDGGTSAKRDLDYVPRQSEGSDSDVSVPLKRRRTGKNVSKAR